MMRNQALRHIAMDGIWRNNMVPFQNATIQDIAKVLEDLYHVKIEVRIIN